MPEQCYLGVDLGAESGRVIAGLFDGARMRLHEVHRFPNGPVSLGGSLRWDVARLWSEIQAGLTKAGDEYGDSVVSIGVDTWGVDFALLSATNELLGQPGHYRDSRTQGMLAKALSRVPRAQIFRETGIQFMEINSLYQLLALNETNGPLVEMADCLLLMPDFFNWCLCGSRVAEFTNATTTQMYHPVRRDWSIDLLRRLEIPTHIFPEVVTPGTKLGYLRADVADRTGLGKASVVTVGSHDTASAVAAVPTENTGQPKWAYISSGTWSLMGVEVQDAIIDDRALELNVTNEGGIDGTYRLLKNIMGLWLVQECRRSFEREGRSYDYSHLVTLAGEAPEFTALVDPDHEDFLAPDDMPAALRNRCRETGQPEPANDGALVRCALESLALKYRLVLDGLQELTGTTVEVVHIVGGGSQNRLLNQFTANACGRPVVTGPIEATALGNVLVQARAAGEFATLDELRTIARASSEIERYDPTETDRWLEAYGRFRELL